MSDPNMYIWPEADTGGLLEFYIGVEPSDPAVIKNFGEAADETLSGKASAKTTPQQAAEYLTATGARCVDKADALRSADAGDADLGELSATLDDIEALGELALYHAEKIRAGEGLALYLASDDFGSLLSAGDHLGAATPHWERLSAVTDSLYTDRQVTGPIDNGHWKDKLLLVREDVDRIDELIELRRSYGGAVCALDFGGVPEIDEGFTRVKAMQT